MQTIETQVTIVSALHAHGALALGELLQLGGVYQKHISVMLAIVLLQKDAVVVFEPQTNKYMLAVK